MREPDNKLAKRLPAFPSSIAAIGGLVLRSLASSPGDLVVDPFIGSGTTALAVVQLGRRCIGFDISDHYVELAKARVAAQQSIQELTAKVAADLAAQLELQADDSATLATAIVTAPDENVIPIPRPAGIRRRARELTPAAPSTV